jgi:signal transduction histidine kinase
VTGALLGAVVLELMLLAIGLPDLEDGQSELNVMITRSGYFLVAAFMLGYFGAYRSRSRHRLARLAEWPSVHLRQGDRAWLKDIVGHARTVLGAGRVAVIYEDIDSLTGTVATCADGELSLHDFDDTVEWVQIAACLDEYKGARSPAGGEGWIRHLATAIGEDALICPRLDNLCVAPFFGTRHRGYLVVLNALYRHEEIESLASIVAGRVSYELERAALIREIASNVRIEERVRLARDLHDSVLQDLTAASLKLKAASRHVAEDAQPLLTDVGAIIAAQQKQIRRFVEGKGAIEDGNGSPRALDRHIRQLGRQWGCEIHLTTTPADLRVSTAMSDNIAQIISEATSNAVRHGAATRIDLVITTGDGRLQLGIADNGTGVIGPFGVSMVEPHSLSARVADLAGRLCVVRDRPGFAMFIELPSR